MRSLNNHKPSETSQADVIHAFQTLDSPPQQAATAQNKPVALKPKAPSLMRFVFTQIANPADTSRADAAAFAKSLAR